MQDNKDVPPTPSLAKLLKTEVNVAGSRQQQHFDSGGGMMVGGGDSWGSISKMLHQRYNSGPTEASTGKKHFRKCLGYLACFCGLLYFCVLLLFFVPCR